MYGIIRSFTYVGPARNVDFYVRGQAVCNTAMSVKTSDTYKNISLDI